MYFSVKQYAIAVISGTLALATLQTTAQTKKPTSTKPATNKAPVKPAATNTGAFIAIGDGLEYKVIKAGTGTKSPVFQDVIEVHLVQKIGDSITYSTLTNNAGNPMSITVQPPNVKGDLANGIVKMKEGDSTLFRINLDTMASRINQQKPDWTKPGDHLTWAVKLVKIKTAAEIEAEKKAQQEAMMQQQAAAASKAQAQAETDDKLITEYLKSKGISNFKRTESGLYYVIQKEGQGEHPKAGQKVTVNYTGVNMMGETFDSNVDPKFNHVEPFQFNLGMRNVIAGWDEGIALLNKGAKATLYIPSGMAYGPMARGPQIPADAILIFDVELVSFED